MMGDGCDDLRVGKGWGRVEVRVRVGLSKCYPKQRLSNLIA